MRLVSLCLAVSAGFGVVIAMPAAGGSSWCADDPLITVRGNVAHAITGFDSDYIGTLTGPVQYYVLVPQSLAAETSVDASMAALPTSVIVYPIDDLTWQTYFSPSVDVVVMARVPSRTDFATMTTVSGLNYTDAKKHRGKSNHWVTITYNFGS